MSLTVLATSYILMFIVHNARNSEILYRYIMFIVYIGVCGGHCSSFSNFLKRNGFYELGCDCCRAKTKVTKTVELKCSMNTHQAFNIREAETCSCEACEMDIINVQ